MRVGASNIAQAFKEGKERLPVILRGAECLQILLFLHLRGEPGRDVYGQNFQHPHKLEYAQREALHQPRVMAEPFPWSTSNEGRADRDAFGRCGASEDEVQAQGA